MSEKYKAGGYVKLAKLWERSAQDAIQYHNDYYQSKFEGDEIIELAYVYIDITGQKEIRKRPEMIRLLSDCRKGKIDLIATHTKAYLAANNRELYYLLHMIFHMDHEIHIVTEDRNYHINTIENPEGQKEALKRMVSDYVRIYPEDYAKWKTQICEAMDKIDKDDDYAG